LQLHASIHCEIVVLPDHIHIGKSWLAHVRRSGPRKWNHAFIDLPVVDKNKQNAPSISFEIMTGLAAWKNRRERVLFILCGAARMRISEALGLEIDKHISEDFLTLFIRQKARGKQDREPAEDRLLRPGD
jgi:hypothetical protein